jgi:enamine deaminase RidA (YjgF/YER057c/UK114 family)
MRRTSLRLTFILTLFWSLVAGAQSNVRHIQEDDRPIATGVWVGDTLYLSGQLASPVSPADAAKGTAAVYGDTETQTMSTLTKIEAALKNEGLTMSDVVMMHVYMAARSGEGRQTGFPRNDGGLHALFRNQGATQQACSQHHAGRGLSRTLGSGGD